MSCLFPSLMLPVIISASLLTFTCVNPYSDFDAISTPPCASPSGGQWRMNSVAIRRDICFIIDFSLELNGRIIRVTETVFMLQIVGNADILILKTLRKFT
jgi:hypothetical protein